MMSAARAGNAVTWDASKAALKRIQIGLL